MDEVKNRPTKKQRELLTYIDKFIKQHGYGPSYREVMRGLGYNSVATVASHIDNLIAKGHLRKKDNSARSLQVVHVGGDGAASDDFKSPKIKPSEEKWLVNLINKKFDSVDGDAKPTQDSVDELYVLTGALKVLGFESAYLSFADRLARMRKKIS